MAWLAERNRAIPAAPVFADGCAGAGDVAGTAPIVITPGEGQIVTLLPGVPARNQVVAMTASTRAPMLSWFVDGALIATVPASERVFWTPTPGKHQVVVADDAGRKASRALEVCGAASQRATINPGQDF